jgi:hypothetical protein
MNCKNILIFPSGNFPSKRASSINTVNHAKSFAKKGFSVDLVHTNLNFEFIEKPKNVNLIYLKISKFRKILFFLKTVISKKYLFIFSRDMFISFLFGFRFKVIHDLHVFPKYLGTKYNLLFTICYKLFTNVQFLCISKLLFDDVVDYYGYSKKIHKINDVSGWKIENDFKVNNPLRICYFGSLDKSKNWKIITDLAINFKTDSFYVYTFSDISQIDNRYFSIENLNFIFDKSYQELEFEIKQNVDIILIPNLKKQNLRGVDIGRHTSPLKLFDALVSNKIVILNNLEIFEEFNKINNLFFTSNTEISSWIYKVKEIKELIKNNQLKLGDNNFEFPLTYDERVNKIFEL